MIAKDLSISVKKAYHYIDGIFRVINDILCEADPEVHIEIRRFGVLEVVKAAAEPAARNPGTNEFVYIPPHRRARFRPGKEIKESLSYLNMKSSEG